MVRFACFLNRRIEFLSQRYGKSFILTALKIRIRRIIKGNESLIKNETYKKITVPLAGKITLKTSDYLGFNLYVEGVYEPHTIDFFVRNLAKGENVLDIGANIGYHTLIMSKLVGPGQVFSFEPNPHILPILYKNIGSNNRKNITVFEVGLSDRNTVQNFYVPDGSGSSSGQASLRSLGGETVIEKIKLIRLESILHTLPKIRLIKMDIEGAEGLALAGMGGFLNRDKPLIIFEFSSEFLRSLGTEPSSVIAGLRNMGFDLYVLSESISHLLLIPETQINILGVHCQDPFSKEFKNR